MWVSINAKGRQAADSVHHAEPFYVGISRAESTRQRSGIPFEFFAEVVLNICKRVGKATLRHRVSAKIGVPKPL